MVFHRWTTASASQCLSTVLLSFLSRLFAIWASTSTPTSWCGPTYRRWCRDASRCSDNCVRFVIPCPADARNHSGTVATGLRERRAGWPPSLLDAPSSVLSWTRQHGWRSVFSSRSQSLYIRHFRVSHRAISGHWLVWPTYQVDAHFALPVPTD